MFSIVTYYVVHCMSLSNKYSSEYYANILKCMKYPLFALIYEFHAGTPGRYCYFNTSIQTCKAGVPQYTILKLVSQCLRCNFATFTFTSKILCVSFNITRLYICRFSYFTSTFSNHLHMQLQT